MTSRPSRSAIFLTAFLAALAIALGLFASVFVPLWRPILLAGVTAAALSGWNERLVRRLGGRRALASGLLVAAVVAVVVGPIATVTGLMVAQIVNGAQSLQATFEHGGMEGLIALLPGRLEGLAHGLKGRLPDSWEGLAGRAAEEGATAAGMLSTAFTATSEVLFEAAMMLIALFFLLVDGRKLVRWLCSISPLGEETTARLLGDLHRTGSSVLLSLVATSAVQGVVATIGFWIARVPQPLVLGLVTFFAAFIPSVGTSIVMLPVAALLLLSGHLVAGIFLAAWAILVTGTIDNVLKPLLTRGGVELHGGVIFFAMLGGIVAYGGLGLLVGPLVVSFLLALIHVGRRELAERRDSARVIVTDEGRGA